MRTEVLWVALLLAELGSNDVDPTVAVLSIGASAGVESVVFGERLLFFFERTRADGAHELVVSSVELSESDRDSPG